MGSNHEKKDCPSHHVVLFMVLVMFAGKIPNLLPILVTVLRKWYVHLNMQECAKKEQQKARIFFHRRFTIVMHGETAVLNKAF